MQLITGPAGSGKSTLVVDRFIESLRVKNHAVRLLVPTATLAQHLQNRIAREPFVFGRNLIQTLSSFIDGWATDRREVSNAALYLLVEQAVARVNRPEFRRVAQLPGFGAAVARTIAEFSSAGCDSERLAAHLPDAPLGAAFLAVYREVDRLLERRKLALRAQRLERAAARIRAEGLGGIRTIWLDGFHVLPDPELAVIDALGQHAEIVVTLSDTDGGEGLRSRLWALGFEEERASGTALGPERRLVRAPGIEREADEIARRIADLAAGGRPFREIGIIVRAADTYVPVLRAALERFAIPARFYFETELEQHPAVRFLVGAVDAMLGGWDHAATLAALRLAPRFADSPAMDRFDFAVREQLPDSGLGGLKAAAGDLESPLTRLIDSLAALEEWRSFEMLSADWAARFRTLRNWFRSARPPAGMDHESALLARGHAAALEAFDQAVGDAALALDPERAIGLGEFWRAVKSAVRLTALRLDDGRRNVVQVLSAPEARQWVLPVVFVCGLVEKQFPKLHPQDPFFSDAARLSLEAAGIRVRTAAELEREERALFDSAITRANSEVTLSYPETDARGERNLRSLYLEELHLEEEAARSVRPQPREVPSQPAAAVIRAPGLLTVLRERTARVSPSGLESYAQCPFQYFGSRILHLRSRPLRPDGRLDFSKQGELVHTVLAEWRTQPQEIGPLFDRHFGAFCEEEHIVNGYHTERLRQAMRRDLEDLAVDTTWPLHDFRSVTEHEFEFRLDESLTLAGRIDRIDTDARGRSYVIDYKYSIAQRVKDKLKNGDSFQGPLYCLAAEKTTGVQPTGMFYISLKGGVEYTGWSAEPVVQGTVTIPQNWLRDATARALGLAGQMRQGRIAPEPADRDRCRFCDSRDVCRIEVRSVTAVAERA
jgi:ATP-dependent helicase/DNAse subunit B